MISRRVKIKKKRFEKLKAPYFNDRKRLHFLGSLSYDDIVSFEEDEEYEADDEEYEESEEESLESEALLDFGI